ncbi:MAG: NifU family protein [Patescibacteria group bacterium]
MTKQAIVNKIKSVLAQSEPYIAGHGGHITFVNWDTKTGVVKVSLQGACATCSISQITLKYGLEEALKKELPQVKQVEPV